MHVPSLTKRCDPLAALDEALRPCVVIRPGTRADYLRLARHHYCATPPATIVQTLVIADGRTDEAFGVLTVSMPTLNGAWRARLGSPRAAGPSRASAAARARRLNRTLRTISRVIVDPRYRVRGVATALVRAYLDAPQTPCTEAIAAMGRPCRFFARAGMTPVRAPIPARHARLLAHLDAARIPPWTLADPQRTTERLHTTPQLLPALHRWANDARATRRFLRADPTHLARHAAHCLLAARTIYIHTRD